MVYPSIPIYGLLVVFLGVLLLWRQIKPFLKRNLKGITCLILVFIVFFVAFLYGPNNLYSNRKIVEITINGLLLLFAYSVFNSSAIISNTAISQSLITTVIAFFVMGIQQYGFTPPDSFIDYEWYRYNSVLLRDEEISGVGYQSIGMNALYAFVFLLSQNKPKGNNIIVFLYYMVGVQLILSSGARQAIFGLIVIFIIYVLYYNESKNIIKRVSTVSLGLFFVYLGIRFVMDLDIGFIANSLNPERGDYLSATGREPIYLTAISIINEFPLFGVGLGGFSEYSAGAYPHNFILEIITETGLVGLLLLTIIIIVYFKSSNISLKHKTANGTFFFIILACLFIRALFSSDLTESIGLFSGILALNNTYLMQK